MRNAKVADLKSVQFILTWRHLPDPGSDRWYVAHNVHCGDWILFSLLYPVNAQMQMLQISKVHNIIRHGDIRLWWHCKDQAASIEHIIADWNHPTELIWNYARKQQQQTNKQLDK